MTYRTFVVLSLVVLIVVGCSDSPDREDYAKSLDEPVHCYTGEASPMARKGLITSFMKEVENVKTDQEEASNLEGMVWIEGGQFEMGGDNEQARKDEFPKHTNRVSGFWMDQTEVTNRQFQEFIEATGYATTAEKEINLEDIKAQLPEGTEIPPDIDLAPFALVFNKPSGDRQRYGPADWWMMVKGADWAHPQGPESNINEKGDHPVVQISWYDAAAYCKWKGKRLPTEAEWEYAARGGQSDIIYPWGNEQVSEERANYWQGDFPVNNLDSDGFGRLAPVRSFPPNKFGLYDMSGNVWEWCQDWYHHDYYQMKADDKVIENPAGPVKSYDPMEPSINKKVVRGGSFLCNDSYCSGYRVAARMKSSPDTGLEHTGCRCVRDGEKKEN